MSGTMQKINKLQETIDGNLLNENINLTKVLEVNPSRHSNLLDRKSR